MVIVRPITKTVRLSGDADTIEDAVSAVLGRAALTVDRIRSFRIVDIGGEVAPSGVPTGYRVTLDVVFEIKDSTDPG